MNKMLLTSFLIAFLFSCKNERSPKEIAKEFVQAVYAADHSRASMLTTEKTKPAISEITETSQSMSADESFSLSTLTETVEGNTAEVKNDLIKLSLQKEGEGWKVAATPELITNIRNRQNNLTALKNAWDALQKEYEDRLRLAKEYVQYKKAQGALSQQLLTLEEMTNTLSVKTVWDKEKILLYVQRQNQLDDLVDKALEPSYTAGSDISMNYFLQLSNAGDRIEKAQAQYQVLAEKTPSAIYPHLPM